MLFLGNVDWLFDNDGSITWLLGSDKVWYQFGTGTT